MEQQKAMISGWYISDDSWLNDCIYWNFPQHLDLIQFDVNINNKCQSFSIVEIGFQQNMPKSYF